jgi:hypothetical protein
MLEDLLGINSIPEFEYVLNLRARGALIPVSELELSVRVT